MRRLLIAAVLCGFGFGCGDNLVIAPDPDAGPADDASVPGQLTGCLERPEDLITPPGDTLPCSLIPPGLVIGD